MIWFVEFITKAVCWPVRVCALSQKTSESLVYEMLFFDPVKTGIKLFIAWYYKTEGGQANFDACQTLSHLSAVILVFLSLKVNHVLDTSHKTITNPCQASRFQIIRDLVDMHCWDNLIIIIIFNLLLHFFFFFFFLCLKQLLLLNFFFLANHDPF